MNMEWFILTVSVSAQLWVLFKLGWTLWRPIQVFRRARGVIWPILAPIFDVVVWARLVSFSIDGMLTFLVMLFNRAAVPGRVGAAAGALIALFISIGIWAFELTLTSDFD